MRKIWFSMLAALIPTAMLALALSGPAITAAATPILAMLVAGVVVVGMHLAVRPAAQA